MTAPGPNEIPGGASAPTVTTEWAEAYFARRLYPDVWRTADGPDRRKALDGASAVLNAAFLWDDAARPDGVWRDEVLALVCEEALWLLERGGEPFPGALGVSRASAGPIAVTFASGAAPGFAAGLISPAVAELAAAWGRPTSGGGRICSTPLG